MKGELKSLGFLNHLFEALLKDFEKSLEVSLSRDALVMQSRGKHEGLSFYTITLPSFSDALERGLASGRWEHDCITSFKRRKNQSLPVFLQGLTSLVFDVDGTLRKEPSHAAIFALRQICRFAKKLRVSCSEARTNAAIRQYSTTDDGLRLDGRSPAFHQSLMRVRRIGRWLSSELFGDYSPFRLQPRHGPGAVFERVRGGARYEHMLPTRRQTVHFTYDWFFQSSLCSSSGVCLEADGASDERPARIVTVPKTLKGPRVIAVEPAAMQYLQQGLMTYVVDQIETSELTRNSVRFRDQEPNKLAAQRESVLCRRATVDLSEASDRIHPKLVREIFGGSPLLREALFRSRTSRAQLPNGEIRPIFKFSSMGSALCFPVEAFAFYCICLEAFMATRKLSITRKNIVRCSRDIDIYGDDLIVPIDILPELKELLESLGLKINTTKTFGTGKFRESCGGDFYDGTSVTPTYLRSIIPSSLRASTEVMSLVATSNLLHRSGLWLAADYIKSTLRNLGVKLAISGETAVGLQWFSFNGPEEGLVRGDLQRPEVRTLVPISRKDPSDFDGHIALLHFFLQDKRLEPGAWSRMLARPHAVKLRSGWVPVLPG